MRPRPLPERTFEEVLEAFPRYRQSMLGDVDNCALMARFDLEGAEFNTHEQARGTLFHRYAAEILRTLQTTGQVSIPVSEALEVLYEVCRQRDVPSHDVVVIPQRERKVLRSCAIGLVWDRNAGPKGKPREFNMRRLLDVEKRLTHTLRYEGPDGNMIDRVISGQPDAVLADPPDGVVVIDWKTTRSAPGQQHRPSIDDEKFSPGGETSGISYEGYWQQRFYALLIMANYPSVSRVTLREFYVLPGEARIGVVTREALEHIEREIADVCAFLDRALMEGSRSPIWQPSPGRHCTFCRRPQSCPIEVEARAVEGGLTGLEQAKRVASEFVVADRVRDVSREALKAWHDETHEPIPVKSAKGRFELRWGSDASGRRRFGMHVPETSDRGAHDPVLEEAFMQAAAEVAK
jgi:hypothetical protein